MAFKLSEKLQIGKVVLKVNDLSRMVEFYRDVIGLELYEKNDHQAQLGIQGQNQVLVELQALDQPVEKRTRPGLYHMAFLLPDRQDLGHVLRHFQKVNQPLTGSADHGYSEAIYLYDPEYNGIEIYVDKDKSQWDYQDDGKIEGVTEPLDLLTLYDLAQDPVHSQFPQGTVMGHVHLQVSDVEHSRYFLGQVLGLDLKSEFNGQALFYAAGDYHHHIGNNEWATKGKQPAADTDPGLAYFELIVPDLGPLIEHLDDIDYVYEVLDGRGIRLDHPDRIDFHILQA